MKKELNKLSATEAASLLGRGELSAETLIGTCFEQIEIREDLVHAWEHIQRDDVMRQARSRDVGEKKGPLYGLPVAIKDIIDTDDMPTGYGSPIFNSHQPATNAHCVEQLKSAGAVIMGKTVTTEFAYLNPGLTRNPHNLEYTPGGSSSGSAAAVADYHVPLALGTQTAGSIIRPASYCGVVGFKPSFATFSTEGIHPFAPSLDTLGGFARSVKDIGLLCSALGAIDIAVQQQAPGKVAFITGPNWDMAEDSTRLMLKEAESFLRQKGVECESPGLSDEFNSLHEAQTSIQLGECVQSLAKYYRDNKDQLSDKLLGDYESALTLDKSTMDEAYEVVASCRELLTSIFSNYDLVITASSPGRAPKGLDATGNPVFNRMWTALGVPCINLPVPQPEGELPLGVQLVGAMQADALLLNHAAWLEEEFHNYRPSR